MTRPELVVPLADAVLVRGRALAWVLASLNAEERNARLNGGARLSPEWHEVRAAFVGAWSRVAASGPGSGAVPPERVGPPSVDLLATREAADVIGMSARGVRYAASRGEMGRKVRGVWVFDRAEVEAYALVHQERTS